MKTANDSTFTNIPLHIQIGVTGHRDLKLTEQLKKSIDAALTSKLNELLGWNERYCTPITFSVLTPLAEGADRYVAARAMEVLGAKMHVILPMSNEEYITSFTSVESILEFETLLKQAEHVHNLIKKPLSEKYPGEDYDKQRVEAYKNVGHFVVKNCDILIVMWNKKKSESEAGTGAIAEFARKRKKTRILIDSNNPKKTSIHKGDRNIIDLLKQFEHFNSFKIDTDKQQTQIEQLLNDEFLPKNSREQLNKADIEYTIKNVMPWYVKADTLAMQNQGRYGYIGLLIYILSPVAVSLVALGILIKQAAWEFFALEFLLLLFAYSAISIADKFRFHKNWVGCRNLAEHMRCAIYISMCGFRHTFKTKSVKFPILHRAENWAEEVYYEIVKTIPPGQHLKHLDLTVTTDYIRQYWIGSQIDFHQNKIKRTGPKGRRLKTAGEIVFFLALISAFFHVVLVLGKLEEKLGWANELATFVAITFPALGASLGAIRTHGEYHRLEKQSLRMADSLAALIESDEEITSAQTFSRFLERVQSIMMADVHGWHALMELMIIISV